MCRKNVMRFACGHHYEIAGIQKCPLTLASKNFVPCSIPGEWPTYTQDYCTACSRADWNNKIIELEEQNWKNVAKSQNDIQNATQVDQEQHEEAAYQIIHQTIPGNQEQEWVRYGQNVEMDIQGDGPYLERVTEVVIVKTTNHTLNGENQKMVQFGDMEPVPDHPDQHLSTAVRSEYAKTKAGIRVFWDFYPHSESSRDSTEVEYVGYSLQQEALLPELSTDEVHQLDDLDTSTIDYTFEEVQSPMQRPRSKSFPSIHLHSREQHTAISRGTEISK